MNPVWEHTCLRLKPLQFHGYLVGSVDFNSSVETGGIFHWTHKKVEVCGKVSLQQPSSYRFCAWQLLGDGIASLGRPRPFEGQAKRRQGAGLGGGISEVQVLAVPRKPRGWEVIF